MILRKVIKLIANQTSYQGQFIRSEEENYLIHRAWPFEAKDRLRLSTDFLLLRKEILAYYGINDKARLNKPHTLSDLLQDIDCNYGIKSLSIRGNSHAINGDSGLIIASFDNGVQLIRPSAWRKNNNLRRKPLETTMLFHTLPKERASISLLLGRVVRGRLNQLILIIVIALIAVLISLAPTWLQSYIFNEIVPNGQKYLMVQMGIFLLFIKFTTRGLKLFNQFIGLRLELYMSLNTTALLVDKLLKLDKSFIDKYSVGDLQQRVNSAHALRKALQQSFVATITSSFVVLLNIILIYFQTYSLELCMLLLMASLLGPGVDTVAAIVETLLRVRRLTLAGKLQDDVLSPLESIQTVRSLALEKDVVRQFADTRSRIARIDVQIGLLKTILSAVTLCLNAAVISFLFYIFSSDQLLKLLGDAAGSGNGQPSQGVVVLLLSAFSTINGAVRQLSSSTLSMIKVIPDTIRFRPLVRAEFQSQDLQETNITILKIENRFMDINNTMQMSEEIIMPGDSIALLVNDVGLSGAQSNNPEELSSLNGKNSGYTFVINDKIRVNSIKTLSLLSQTRVISEEVVINAGTLINNITDYASGPDVQRLNTCLGIIGFKLDDAILSQAIDPLIDTSLLQPDLTMKIMIARALYAEPKYVYIRNILDLLPIDITTKLIKYAESSNTCVMVETHQIDIANICKKKITVTNFVEE